MVVPLIQAVAAASSSDAARGAVRTVHPVALLVAATPPAGPDDLLAAAVTLTPAVHPYAATWLDRVGRRLDEWTWSVPNAQLADALRVFEPSAVTDTGVQVDHVTVTARARRSRIKITAASKPSRLRYDDAEDVIVTSILQVFDASSGALAAWTRLRETSVVARAQPGSPNLARLVDGRRLEQVLAASDAVSKLDATSHGSVACDPLVAELADLAHAAPVDDAVLLDPQRRVVGRYLSSANGLVCALPPGSGKTVVAARCLHFAPGVSVVVAPAGLESQWRSELGRFAPGVTVHVVRTLADAKTIPAAPVAVLVAPRLLHAIDVSHIVVDNLVIDEAAFLSRWSKQTAGAWVLRAQASKVLLLTGTPARRRIADLGGLVSFVMNNRKAFQGVPLGADWQDRVGPLVSGVDDASVLPASTRTLITCEPGPAEVALLTGAALALTTARAELARAEASNEPGVERNRLRHIAQVAFERARLAGTDPIGVTGDAAALAQTITTPSKRAALAQLCADGVTTVVCCDSAVVATAVAASLQDSGVRAAALTGALTRDAQSKTVQMLGGDISVLVTAAVGQMGWNLQAASRVVHYDVPLTPAAARQREGRVRRVGAGESKAVCLLLAGAVDTDAALAWALSSVDDAGL